MLQMPSPNYPVQDPSQLAQPGSILLLLFFHSPNPSVSKLPVASEHATIPYRSFLCFSKLGAAPGLLMLPYCVRVW